MHYPIPFLEDSAMPFYCQIIPCLLQAALRRIIHPASSTWSATDELPSGRAYHSVMLLMPNGKVMMAGGTSGEGNPGIEIYSPPYLFRGARPVISSAPALVHHGQSFTIESPNALSVVKVVLVRRMAVTHQTDAEQRVLEMPYLQDHANPTCLTLTAPYGCVHRSKEQFEGACLNL